MQTVYLGGKVCKFTVLNEFTKMQKTTLFCIWDISNENYDRIDNRFLILKTTFFPENIAKEIHPTNRVVQPELTVT